ncbi:MAG TPA: arginase family protein, partial [Gaiellaceae bacterium]|nr:arginase family protein [Gaiellaceae bacterium]
MAVQRKQPVAVIGAALDLGAGRRGVDMGPSAIRYAGLYQRLRDVGLVVDDWGNVASDVAEATDMGDASARYLLPVKRTCERVAALVRRAVESGGTPLVLGGDHSVALGSIGGLASVFGAGGAIWIDAHGDLNTPETSPSGNVHGMVLAAVLGLAADTFASDAWPMPALDPSRVALVGVRSLDQGEKDRIR